MLWNNKIIYPDMATNEEWGKSPIEPSLPILDLDSELPYFPHKTPIKTIRKVELQLEYSQPEVPTELDFTTNERLLTAQDPLRH